MDMSVTDVKVLVMLYAGPDGLEALAAFESKAITLVEKHHGRLETAFRPETSANPDQPDEIHLLEFPSSQAFENFKSDPAHNLLANERRRAISKTTVIMSGQIIDYS